MPAKSPQSLEKTLFFHTYNRLPVEIERGDGAYLYAKDGTRYLDMFSGIAVNALGHNYPKILKAIAEQTTRYLHLSNYFIQEPQLTLVQMLVDATGLNRAFLTNSGTEATEGAMKIARRFGSVSGKTHVVGFSDSFHGRSLGALSLMDREGHLSGFGPFLPNCSVLPFNDCASLDHSINSTTLALFLECIQGEGGIHQASQEFVDRIQQLRQKYGFLLVVDEVQSGLGRTGRFLACEHYGIKPDIVLLAKALGGGLPLGAILGNERVADVLQPGTHGSTFGGNPVACAAGAVVLRELRNGELLKNVTEAGARLRSGLSQLRREFPSMIKEVRGIGLMLGIELLTDPGGIVEGMRERRVLVNTTGRNVLRIVPPLNIGQNQIEEFIGALRETIEAEAKSKQNERA